jgi:hypothetical protein
MSDDVTTNLLELAYIVVEAGGSGCLRWSLAEI